jgi:hypothetical protein
MIVNSVDKNKKKFLEKELSIIKTDKNVVINMGGRMGKGVITLNNSASVQMAYERETRNSIISNIIPTLQSHRDANYPCLIKDGRRKRTSFDEDSLLIKSVKEWRVFYNMFGGNAFTERIFHPTDEYLLFCTPSEIFFTVKLIRKEHFKDKVIMPDNGYISTTSFTTPKLWRDIESAAKATIKALGLDFGVVKIGYSSADIIVFYIHSVKTELPLIEGMLNPFIDVITRLIEQKSNYLNRLNESLINTKRPSIKKEFTYVFG